LFTHKPPEGAAFWCYPKNVKKYLIWAVGGGIIFLLGYYVLSVAGVVPSLSWLGANILGQHTPYICGARLAIPPGVDLPNDQMCALLAYSAEIGMVVVFLVGVLASALIKKFIR
jgi:hypothetical protein